MKIKCSTEELRILMNALTGSVQSTLLGRPFKIVIVDNNAETDKTTTEEDG